MTFWIAIGGLLVLAMLFLLLLSSSEEAMFDRIVLRSVPPGTSQQETATSLLHAAHALVETGQAKGKIVVQA